MDWRCSPILCFFSVYVIATATSQQPRTLKAQFSSGGVKSEVTFTQNTPAANFCVKGFKLAQGVSRWQLHAYRVQYDVPDRCDAGRLGPRLYPNGTMGNVTLFGQDSIEGRSMVLLNSDNKIIACANVERTGNYITARATFRKGVLGAIMFRQHASSATTLTRVTSDLHLGNPGANGMELNWMVASTHDCLRVCKVYSPRQNSSNDACGENAQMSCAIGDLRGKLGAIPVGPTQGSSRMTAVDLNLPLSGPDSVLGKTIQIFATGDVKPRACAVITAYVPRTGVAKFNQKGAKGDVFVTQRSPFDPTLTRVCFKSLRSMGEGYHIHNLPVPQRLTADQNVCGMTSVSGHFNPFAVVYDDQTPAAGEGTGDMYEVGDLGKKYGLLSGLDTINKMYTDFNLPLFGVHSVLGRAVVLHRAATDSGQGMDMGSSGHNASMGHGMGDDHDTTTYHGTSMDGHNMAHGQTAMDQGQGHSGHSHDATDSHDPNRSMGHDDQTSSGDMTHHGHDRWMCSTLHDTATFTYALATFKYPVIGHVLLRQRVGDDGDTSVYVMLDYADGSTNITTGHFLSLHQTPASSDDLNADVNARCLSAGAVFDPFFVSDSTQCGPTSPRRCKVGSLSDKHGAMSVRAMEGAPSRAFFVDQDLTLQGPQSVIGKSVVLTGPGGSHVRLACAVIYKLWPRQADFMQWGVATFTQNTWIVEEPTKVQLNLNPLGDGEVDYSLSTLPVSNEPGERCSNLGGIFNPFGVSDTTPANGTKDQYPVGDLSGKFGRVSGSSPGQLTLVDPTLDLMGPLSVAGRALTLRNSARVVCGDLFDRGMAGGMYLSAVAKFTGDVVGEITLRQFLYRDGTTTHTTVLVNLRNAEDPQTTGHNWHVHVSRVGDDATASTGRCVSTGGHYNPYMVNVQQNYDECSMSNPLRCELGDQARKLGQYDLGSGVMIASDVDLPLIGLFTVVGRSIVVHAANSGGPRIACADIMPGLDTAVFHDVHVQAPAQIDRQALAQLLSTTLQTESYNIVVDVPDHPATQNVQCLTVRVYFLGLESRQLKEKLLNFLAFSSNAFGGLSPCTFEPVVCSLTRQGTVTMFSKEKFPVKQPCNYKLADLTCGQYDVTVTARNALDSKFKYYPSYFKVKVTSKEDSMVTWEGEMTTSELEKCLDGPSTQTPTSPWTTLRGANYTSDLVAMDRKGRSTTVSDSGDTFRVNIRLGDPRKAFSISCKDLKRSESYPASLCHSPSGDVDVLSERKTELGLRGKSQVVLYDVLNNQDMDQTAECKTFVDGFQDCKNEAKTIKSCEKILASCKVLTSLKGDYSTWFNTCLKAHCDDDKDSLKLLRKNNVA
ncbi:uncharacterized protein [Littorina saxatilis]|uniref:Superoxide dismutase copper/zinc binding domain-containing protein n=1 Tax=Littorina saxatilis TaxID=31220 RepID=A0AAN9BXF5_9CAEN